MEFFGQIENKSMGWAVRAHDTQNYYAMKLTVIEPGLRPVIAMVHYPVVGGKKGRPVEIPLNVMVHNNTPMQVEVDVHGNKLLTSVDGQLVDTWIDDTLVAGGVGFLQRSRRTGAAVLDEDFQERRFPWPHLRLCFQYAGRRNAAPARNCGPIDAPGTPPQPQPVPERTQEAALALPRLELQQPS